MAFFGENVYILYVSEMARDCIFLLIARAAHLRKLSYTICIPQSHLQDRS
jgi:hypothetical protein